MEVSRRSALRALGFWVATPVPRLAPAVVRSELSPVGKWLEKRIVLGRLWQRFPWLLTANRVAPRSSAENDRLQVMTGRFELHHMRIVRKQLLRMGL